MSAPPGHPTQRPGAAEVHSCAEPQPSPGAEHADRRAASGQQSAQHGHTATRSSARRGAEPGAAAPAFSVERLEAALRELDPTAGPAEQLTRLTALGLERLPLPGGGATLTRWRALAAVAAHDLSLAKLYEGHTDALAILAELGAGLGQADLESTDATWGVWAAEAPEGRARIESVDADGSVWLGGAKFWCSGALGASHALLTAWHGDGRGPQLVRIPLRQAGLVVESGGWHAVGMAASASLTVRLAGAHGECVGAPGAYLSRPGFWQGGAGVAACWFGGARALGEALQRAVAEAPAAAAPSPFRLAALGKIDVALRAASALLREAATWVDDHPREDASEVALCLRLAVEGTAAVVLDEVGRALGATPYCRNPWFARMAADLPVFLRQSHGDRDFAALGEKVAAASDPRSAADRAAHPVGARRWPL